MSVCAHCTLKPSEFTVAHLTVDSAVVDEMHCLAYQIDLCVEFVPVEYRYGVTRSVEQTVAVHREKEGKMSLDHGDGTAL